MTSRPCRLARTHWDRSKPSIEPGISTSVKTTSMVSSLMLQHQDSLVRICRFDQLVSAITQIFGDHHSYEYLVLDNENGFRSGGRFGMGIVGSHFSMLTSSSLI